MLRKLIGLAACIGMAACASTAATTIGFPAADANDDDLMNLAEWNEFDGDSDLFTRYDDDDDGNLTRTEYNEAVDPTFESDAYFAGLDADRSGNLSRSEFIDGWFRMFDSDSSGTLTRGEFDNAVEALEFEL